MKNIPEEAVIDGMYDHLRERVTRGFYPLFQNLALRRDDIEVGESTGRG